MQASRNYRRESKHTRCLLVRLACVAPSLADDVRHGLLTLPRSLPPKYFYDAKGSALFERICRTPEYYLTRTETELLIRVAEEIIAMTRPAHIIELGSGSARKTRYLFNACKWNAHICTYWPLDVCEDTLRQASLALSLEYPWLHVRPLLGDYSVALGYLPQTEGTRMFVFLGSTIGNFDAEATTRFLSELRACMAPGDWLLLGADRVKDPAVLHAAYNDAEGVTVEFNLNVLRILNRELNAHFDLAAFAHQAVYNERLEQIEMYLVSLKDQKVPLGALNVEITVECGEKILSEISRKYTYNSLDNIIAASGLRVIRHYQPDNEYFSLVLAQAPLSGT